MVRIFIDKCKNFLFNAVSLGRTQTIRIFTANVRQDNWSMSNDNRLDSRLLKSRKRHTSVKRNYNKSVINSTKRQYEH